MPTLGHLRLTAKLRSLAIILAIPPILAASGAQALQCTAGTIKFHKDDGIQRCVIDANHRLYTAKEQPIDCLAGHAVTLHPSGKLESCHISGTHVVLGMPCSGPARIELDEVGGLRGCTPE
jgi:hypothetical protein